MATNQILRWAARSVLRHPAPWLIGALLMSAWPTLARLTGLALTTDRGDLPGMVQQLLTLALVAGVLWGQSLATRADWLLSRAVGWQRLRAEALLMATPAVLFAAATLTPAMVLGGASWSSVLAIGASGLLSLLHLVSMALVLGHGHQGSFARDLRRSWWALPVIAWIVPAWLSGTGPIGAHLASWFDVRLPLAPFGFGPFGSPGITALLPIVAWTLLSVLLAAAPFSQHAIRRPR